ncbi:tetratricopeptide repeat protein [Fulvimarina sp. 2208YS6-2-32]|uniref:Tetratricopeptide repeat protein n=1 Tax=Fulvimarina uroteuthidis TaxID=3098149 RepID=A0ABU5HZN4_9HYPH|nr:tetratricopeptide repeat protein [Fulvimarina sp. 2208YS6-2-32]MDY8108008.1 tetratricopeptide repeat protein [Fulvimarina sp. 2208YS6-2-32]
MIRFDAGRWAPRAALLSGLLAAAAAGPVLAQNEPMTPDAARPDQTLPVPDLRPSLAPEAGEDENAGAAIPDRGAANRQGSSASAYAAFQRGYYLSAMEIAEPLAKLGDPAAQALLGEIYENGLGVPVDVDQAARWFEAAAESGDPAAQFSFAMLLLSGTGIARDEARALELLKQAADAKLPLAEFNYAQLLVQTSPASGFAAAVPYFRSAGNAGIADAQYAMSQLLASGQGIEKSETDARDWLRRAAVNGFGIAEIEYGIWLLNGRGGPKRSEEGFDFLRKAALDGNAIAINRVAHLYKDGLGTKPDIAEAAKWAVIAKRLDNSDPVLDDFFKGLSDEAQKAALEEANRFRTG